MCILCLGLVISSLEESSIPRQGPEYTAVKYVLNIWLASIAGITAHNISSEFGPVETVRDTLPIYGGEVGEKGMGGRGIT